MSKVRIKHRQSFVERALGVWRRFREVKHGLFGLAVVIAFFIIAVIAPVVFPFYPGQLARVGPGYAAPEWMSWTNPLDPPTANYLPDSNFESDTYWTFNTSNSAIASYSYDTTDYVEGSRSLKLTLSDNNNSVAYTDRVTATTTFEWSYSQPAMAYLYFTIKSRITGNLTDSSVIPYFETHIPPEQILPTNYYIFEINPAYPTAWTDLRRLYNYYALEAIYEPGATITFDIGLGFIEGVDPTLVGTVEFWFDDIQIWNFSEFWGPLGTTDRGQDVLAQLFWGAQISLFIGIVATFIGVLVGLLLGLMSGYFGGVVDELIMRVTDFFIIMPALPVMMILSSLLNPSLEVTVFVIALFSWSAPARVIRSQTLVEKEKAYVEAAKAAGAGDVYLIFRHVFPNVLTLVFVQIATGVSSAILWEAGLSFLGLTPQNLVSWGRMLQAAYNQAAMQLGAWWFVIPPGFCIALLSLGFVFIGYAVDKALNPRLRRL